MTAIRNLCISLCILALFSSDAIATVIHVTRQGDTVTSLATEYYGDATKALIIRAVNRIPSDEEVELELLRRRGGMAPDGRSEEVTACGA